MKRLVILCVESTMIAGFTNRGVKVYSRDILTDEEVTISIQKRPVRNQIALICGNSVLKTFGDPREPESWRSVIEWCRDLNETVIESVVSEEIDRPEYQAITVDSEKTWYRSDAISITPSGILFHVFDFSDFKITRLGRCSDFHCFGKIKRCLNSELLRSTNFIESSKRKCITVNLNTGEKFKSIVEITDNLTFDQGISEHDIMKWGRSFSEIVCNSVGIPSVHDVTRAMHSIEGVAILTGQINLLDKIRSNSRIEKTVDMISQRLDLFERSVLVQGSYIDWTKVNPIKSIFTIDEDQSDSCSSNSFSCESISENTAESRDTIPEIFGSLKRTSIS